MTANCVFWAILLEVLTSTSVTIGNCIVDCMCPYNSVIRKMSVSCSHNNYAADKLLEEMDQLLSSRLDTVDLEIADTTLANVPSNVCRMNSLRKLVMKRNRVTAIPDHCFDSMVYLIEIDFSYNQLTELQDGLFDNLQMLRSIDFSFNRIANIGLQLLSNESNLLNLATIKLQNNQMTSLEPWPFVRAQVLAPIAKSVLSVNVSHNMISRTMSSVGWKYNCSMKFAYMILNLEYNKIKHFADLFVPLGIDKTWILVCLTKYENDIYMRHNPFVCDCIDFTYYTAMQYNRPFQTTLYVRCQDPPELAYNLMTRMPLEKVVCDITQSCPPGCKCLDRPWNSTLHINCADSNLSSIPQELPVLPKSYYKYHIVLSHNIQLRHIQQRPYFANVSILQGIATPAQYK